MQGYLSTGYWNLLSKEIREMKLTTTQRIVAFIQGIVGLAIIGFMAAVPIAVVIFVVKWVLG